MTKAVDLAKTGSLVNSSGQIDLTTGVTGVLPVANGGTGSSSGVSPGGSTTQVQYNNAGAFGGDSGFVYSSGNVGIGTSSPSSKLHVAGTGTQGITVERTDASTAGLFQLLSGNSTNVINASTAKPISFEINAAERMRITSSGYVGIGISSPYAKFHVNGASNNTISTANFNAVISGSGGDGLGFGTLTSPTYASYIQAGYAADISLATYSLLLNPNGGNVGIGTSSPTPYNVGATLLQVNSGTVNSEVKITNSTTGTGATAGLAIVQSGTTAYFWNGSNGSIGFGTNNTQQAAITSAGLMQFNSGYGSVATAYGCRVWVNWNGQGTPSIRGSGGASSITDNGTGDYTVNFSITLPDTNYCALVTNDHDDGSGSNQQAFVLTSSNSSYANKSTTAIRIQCYNTTSADFDPYGLNLAVFR